MEWKADSYDYIIAGGGMAGLSLAWYLNRSETLRKKKILIIDKEKKEKNDRTWCFWERGEHNPLEAIVYRKWKSLTFHGLDFSRDYTLPTYLYKMIRGTDFYSFVHKQLESNPNIQFCYQDIRQIEAETTCVRVHTDAGTRTASYVFDSIYRPDFQQPNHSYLLQHFKGWILTTQQPIFDAKVVTLHDFRTDQHGDEARFFYILPLSATEALVEYTLFSSHLLEPQQYDAELKAYIRDTLKLTNYTITEEEFGIIPMSDVPLLEHPEPRLVRIGISGGYVRPSTGYTFARTQRYLQQLVQNMEQTGVPIRTPSRFSRRFQFYDRVMLNVLTKKRYPGAKFFSLLYKKNSIERIFDFLDEQTTLMEEIQLMATMPVKPFTAAAANVIFTRSL